MKADAVPSGGGLSEAEQERYRRHLTLPEVGLAGQMRLRAGKVLLIGMGGLGCPAATYLAAAGVGRLGLVDSDRVELSNLQRQVLYRDADQGRLKVEVAAERLREINPTLDLRPLPIRLAADNVLSVLAGWDLVIDGSDNAATRYLVNDACVHLGLPDIWGAVLRFEGQLSIFGLADGPCYRCLFPEPPPLGAVPSCAEAGVLGVLPGIIGAMQASEAIQWLLGRRHPAMVGRFLILDAQTMFFREIALRKDPACPVCANPTRFAPDRSALATTATCEIRRPEMSMIPFEITVEELDRWRREGREHILIDVREPHEFETCAIEGSRLVPMRQVSQELDQLDPAALIVVHCHHGGRSAQAVQFLRQRGFASATNLAGGIDAWSRLIDPSVPRY